MAKKKAATESRRRGPAPMLGAPEREPIEMPGAFVQYGDAGEDAPPDELLEEVLTRLDGNSEAFCIVSKFTMLNGQRREQWLFEDAPTPNIESIIQRGYGEGDYRIRIYQRRVASDGVRRPLLVKNVVVSIGPSRETPTSQAQPGAITQAPQDRIAELVAEMRAAGERANERMQSFMLDMMKTIAASNANKSSTFSDFKDFAAGMGALPKPEKPQNPIEFLTAIIALADKMKGAVAPAVPIDPETGDVGSNAILLKGIEVLGNAFSAAKTAQAIQAQQPGALPPPVQTALPVEQPPENRDVLMMRLFIQTLIDHAKANAPVEDHAEQINTLLTDDAYATLESEQWFEALNGIEPVPPELRPWFARLRDAVIALNAEPEPAPEKSDASKDGSLSQPAAIKRSKTA